VPNNAQNKNSLLGKILRINPLPSGSSAYTIPSTNPFVGITGLNEIWAFGFRNPWRCSFDRSNGNLWCGDVGQSKYEEIDRLADGKGANYGWRLYEGTETDPVTGEPVELLWVKGSGGDLGTLTEAGLAVEVVDEEAVAAVGGHAARRGVGLDEVALALENGHVVAHRGARDAQVP